MTRTRLNGALMTAVAILAASAMTASAQTALKKEAAPAKVTISSPALRTVQGKVKSPDPACESHRTVMLMERTPDGGATLLHDVTADRTGSWMTTIDELSSPALVFARVKIDGVGHGVCWHAKSRTVKWAP